MNIPPRDFADYLTTHYTQAQFEQLCNYFATQHPQLKFVFRRDINQNQAYLYQVYEFLKWLGRHKALDKFIIFVNPTVPPSLNFRAKILYKRWYQLYGIGMGILLVLFAIVYFQLLSN